MPKNLPPSKSEQYQGIILKTMPFSDYDLIIKVLTTEIGKKSFLAKRALKEKNKFGTNFDILDSGIFVAKSSMSSMALLESFKPFKPLTKIRVELSSFIISSCLAECFDQLIHEEFSDFSKDEAKELYETFALGLRAVEETSQLKEKFKALYFALSTLKQLCGIGDFSYQKMPSRNNLVLIISEIENYTQKKIIN